jgi:hypothetical protein
VKSTVIKRCSDCPRSPEFFEDVGVRGCDKMRKEGWVDIPGPDCPLEDVPEVWVDVTDIPPEKRFYESFKEEGGRTFALNSKGCVAFVERLRK